MNNSCLYSAERTAEPGYFRGGGRPKWSCCRQQQFFLRGRNERRHVRDPHLGDEAVSVQEARGAAEDVPAAERPGHPQLGRKRPCQDHGGHCSTGKDNVDLNIDQALFLKKKDNTLFL